MAIREGLIMELQHESAATKKILEKVPVESFSWKPHEKSMSIGRLATHIAETPQWVSRIIGIDNFDFAAHPFKPHVAASTEELLGILDEKVNAAIESLKGASMEEFDKIWTVRQGDTVFYQLPKKVAMRGWAYSHLYHHRGQLTVYLRLLDIPVPGMYGPTADERM